LTEREMEVLHLLGTGKTNKEIGAELYITERTVKFYVSAILGKLGASNRTEAVTLAVQRGIISLT
jgi:DNA-binding NarL/FixJ family response regulator